MSDKHTSKDAASSASNVLRSDDTGDDSRSAAGSAMSQRDASAPKSTGDDAASSASQTLQDGRTSDDSKAAAGSALAQTEN